MTTAKPWHGVLTATALPFRADLSVDYDKYAEHIKWQADNGVHGAIPNGSLGEYQVLTPEERTKVLKTALDAAPAGFNIVPDNSFQFRYKKTKPQADIGDEL